VNLPTLFRWILSLSLLFALIGSVIDLGFPGLLPEELQHYLKMEHESDLVWTDFPIIALALLLLLLVIPGYVGLYLWKNWGRTLFLISGILGYGLAPFMGPYIYSGPAYFFFDLSTVLFGLILGLAWFSPVAEKFKKPTPPPLPV